MVPSSILPQRKKAMQSIKRQIIIMVILAAFIALANWHFAYAFFLGTFIHSVANFCFVALFFTSGKASQAKRILRNFWFGEILKLTISAILCIVTISVLKISIFAFLLGYIIATQVSWLLSFATVVKGESA